jgi:hypothetical protein
MIVNSYAYKQGWDCSLLPVAPIYISVRIASSLRLSNRAFRFLTSLSVTHSLREESYIGYNSYWVDLDSNGLTAMFRSRQLRSLSDPFTARTIDRSSTRFKSCWVIALWIDVDKRRCLSSHRSAGLWPVYCKIYLAVTAPSLDMIAKIPEIQAISSLQDSLLLDGLILVRSIAQNVFHDIWRFFKRSPANKGLVRFPCFMNKRWV